MFRPREDIESDSDIKARLKESFVRLRDLRADDKVAAGSDEDEPEVRDPSVPAKLFIGPEATWYDDRWRWMEWRTRRRSWNGAAAASLGLWFGYRRMYGWLAVHSFVLLAALAMILLGAPLVVPTALLIVAALLAGLYGNHLYLGRFKRQAGRIARSFDTHDEQVEAIRRAGGVDRRIVWVWPAVMVAGALALTVVLGPELAAFGRGE